MAEMKTCNCICCGTEVQVSKFMSATKVKCDSCKNDASAMPNEQILIDHGVKKPQVEMVGDKKLAKCTVCGDDVLIGKFMSPSKAVCDKCKSSKVSSAPAIKLDKLTIDSTKVDMSAMMNGDAIITPGIIANKRLRKVKCPACGHEHMNIIKIVDGSDRGLIIDYNCPKCKLLMVVSEQCKRLIKPAQSHQTFNYRGELMNGLISSLHDTRIKNAFAMIMDKLEEHGIKLDGIEIPSNMYSEYVEDKAEEVTDREIGFTNTNDGEVNANDDTRPSEGTN